MRKFVPLACLSMAALLVSCGASGGPDSSSDKATTTKPSDSTETTAVTDTTDAPAEPVEAADASEYEASLIVWLTSGSEEEGSLLLTDVEASCYSPKFVAIATPDAFGAAGMEPADVEDPSFDFLVLNLDSDQALAAVDLFDGCKVDIVAKLAASLATGLADEQASCIAENIDQDAGKTLVISAFTNEADSEAAFATVIERLTKACDLPG